MHESFMRAAIAQAIVKEREENGAFTCLEDLLRVKGIGESTLEGFRYEAETEENG